MKMGYDDCVLHFYEDVLTEGTVPGFPANHYDISMSDRNDKLVAVKIGGFNVFVGYIKVWASS